MKTKTRVVALAVVAGVLAMPGLPPLGYAQAPAAPAPRAQPQGEQQTPAAEAPQVEPKFLWGVVVRFIAGEVFSAFSQWLATRITDGVKTTLGPDSDRVAGGAVTVANIFLDAIRQKYDLTGGAAIARNPSAEAVSLKDAAANLVADPSTPIRIEGGAPNYQGAHIAIVGADRSGTITGLRAVKDGFRTGERFKVRVVSTFGGLLVIDNINPKGERKQIYPAGADAVVVLKPGADTLLPLGENQFFEFARSTGEEQLVISLRDARAVGNAASKGQVYRKDEAYGSNFMQEVDKDSFPAISEAIRLQHR
jgi:hypothetical protein